MPRLMPDPTPVARAGVSPFLSLGFRPLYLAGAAWAAASIAIWIFTPHWLTPPLAGIAWHAHEMLWGFVATVAVGFLLTASATWTGLNPLSGRGLALTSVLWLIARTGFLIGGETAYVVAAGAELAFLTIAAAAIARVVLRSANRRNFGVPLLLLALGASDAAFLRAASAGHTELLMKHLQAGLLIMAVIALLIARRVIPFFAMRAVHGLQIPMHVRSGQVQLAAAVLAVAGLLLNASLLLVVALSVAGAIAIVQVLTWRPLAVLHKPLLWILYAGYAGLGLGLLAAAAQASGLELRSAVSVHLIAMAGFSVLIIGMMTRTALGHLGRQLDLDRSMLASYVLVLAAAALRLAALWPTASSMLVLQAAALAWIAAFGLYLWRFAPWLVRPRADAAKAPTPLRAA
jgi:uncharacterized protein involved in response to NO